MPMFGDTRIEIGATREANSVALLASKTLRSHDEVLRVAVTDVYLESSRGRFAYTVDSFGLACALIQQLYLLSGEDLISIDFGEGLAIDGRRRGADLALVLTGTSHSIESWECSRPAFILFASSLLSDVENSVRSAGIDLRQLLQWSPPLLD